MDNFGVQLEIYSTNSPESIPLLTKSFYDYIPLKGIFLKSGMQADEILPVIRNGHY